MRFSAIDVIVAGRAGMGKYLSIPHLAVVGFMARVLCRDEYSRQSTLLFNTPLAMDNLVKWFVV